MNFGLLASRVLARSNPYSDFQQVLLVAVANNIHVLEIVTYLS